MHSTTSKQLAVFSSTSLAKAYLEILLEVV
jgi:hypothetical protein